MPVATCRDVVEVLSDYIDGSVGAAERRQLDEHLAACRDCAAYLEQLRVVVRAVRQCRDEDERPLSREDEARFLALVPQSRPPSARSVRLGIDSQYVAAGAHLAYFWESDQDFEAAMGFLDVGLRGGERCFVFGHDFANRRVLDLLQGRSLDTDALQAEGRLAVLGGQRSGAALLASTDARLKAAAESGAPGVRLLGNIGWGLEGWPAEREVLEFEAQVTPAARQLQSVVLCMYDVGNLPGRILLKGGFETHPWTVRRSVVRENRHFVPTEQFLAQLQA